VKRRNYRPDLIDLKPKKKEPDVSHMPDMFLDLQPPRPRSMTGVPQYEWAKSTRREKVERQRRRLAGLYQNHEELQRLIQMSRELHINPDLYTGGMTSPICDSWDELQKAFITVRMWVNLTRDELAAYLGIDVTTIYRIEATPTRNPGCKPRRHNQRYIELLLSLTRDWAAAPVPTSKTHQENIKARNLICEYYFQTYSRCQAGLAVDPADVPFLQ
jgi:hypothetical protein